MIRGEVRSSHEAILPVSVRGSAAAMMDLEAVLDTGFTDYLVLPPSVVVALSLPPAGEMEPMLADGQTVTMRVYLAAVMWDGAERSVLVQESDAGPLVGMAMLNGYHLVMDVVDGGQVLVRPLG